MEKLKNEMLLNFEAGATIGEINETLTELTEAGEIDAFSASWIQREIVKIGLKNILDQNEEKKEA